MFEAVRYDARDDRLGKLGGIAWAAIAVYVIIYDIAAGLLKIPTLSATFHRASTQSRGRFILIAFWFYLTGHLFRWIPPKLDLFRNLHRPIVGHLRSR